MHVFKMGKSKLKAAVSRCLQSVFVAVMARWCLSRQKREQIVASSSLPYICQHCSAQRGSEEYEQSTAELTRGSCLVGLEEAREGCVLTDRRGAEGIAWGAELVLSGRKGAGLALVPGCFKEDMKRVTEPFFPGTALLHLFGFPQTKHYFLDIFNNHSSSHTSVFAFLLLHKTPSLPNLFCRWLAGWEVPKISVDGHSYSL